MVEEEDAVVLRDVKMRIGGAVENKATNKVIGAQATSQPIISALEIDPETDNILTVCAAQASLRRSIKHTYSDPICTPTVVPAGSSFVGPQSVTLSSTSDRYTQSLLDIGSITTLASFLLLSICTETNAQSCIIYETFLSTRFEISINVSVLV